MEQILTVDKTAVLMEVAQTTAYTGAKMEEGDKMLERIGTVDEDSGELERFWEEAKAEVCQGLKGLVSAESETGGNYRLTLELSGSFDPTLKPSMETSLRNYFVYAISARWYVYTNKQESGDYATKARALLEDVHRKALFKKKPTRPVY